MGDTIKITLSDNSVVEVKKGTPFIEIAKMVNPDPPRPIMGAIVNNMVRDLWEVPDRDCNVIFIDISNIDGNRIYFRGLKILLLMAVDQLFPDRDIKILHSLGDGLFCRWDDGSPIKKKDVHALEKKMREFVERDLLIERKEINKEDAIKLFSETGKMDKVGLLKFRRKKTIKVYLCNGYTDYFFGRLPPYTGVLKKFELITYFPGLILRFPSVGCPDKISPYIEQKKVSRIYSEYKHWGEILEVSDVASLNSIIMRGEINNLIRVAEALHEKKIARIADLIAEQIRNLKLILIAGPSSSGKTTFAQRLAVQLRVNGIKPVPISLDDYFVDKEKTPLDKNGDFDFEHVEAIDISLFNEHLQALFVGEEVMMPRFDFRTGKRIENHKSLKLHEKEILMIEGIHALNERLTESISSSNKYKIYVSALTQLNLDNHNRIPTTDTRMVRRIVRDSQFRNHSARETIRQWPQVRRGEERFIFPFQEDADVMFNSALVYELAVLKSYVEPQLWEINSDAPEFVEVKRLLSFTSNFLEVGTDEIPPNSILREFIGATCFFRMELP
ncbi:MAG: nucleoside kinase [Candidatus Eremiobacteraeota bacterium]|nr:nucleoside kinase [Candidatus Eremiobacteraeota bacterium]